MSRENKAGQKKKTAVRGRGGVGSRLWVARGTADGAKKTAGMTISFAIHEGGGGLNAEEGKEEHCDE